MNVRYELMQHIQAADMQLWARLDWLRKNMNSEKELAGKCEPARWAGVRHGQKIGQRRSSGCLGGLNEKDNLENEHNRGIDCVRHSDSDCGVFCFTADCHLYRKGAMANTGGG